MPFALLLKQVSLHRELLDSSGSHSQMYARRWRPTSQNGDSTSSVQPELVVDRADLGRLLGRSTANLGSSVWLLPIDAAHSHLARNLEALLTYVRKSNRRGDRRPPHESLSAPPKK